MNDLISVIVPVYRVEKYLDECVESIVSQTYTNLEIILVDDGSPDNCPKMCDEWAKKDERIRVIHKQNGGLSSARNIGLDVAKGEYISFVDSDDVIADNFVQCLYELCLGHSAQLTICYFKKFQDGDECKFIDVSAKVHEFSPREAILQYFGNNGVLFVIACGKLYQKKFFNDIRFPSGMIHEDEDVFYRVIEKTQKVVVTEACLYGYRQRLDSIMGCDFSYKRLDYIKIAQKRFEHYQQVDDELYQRFYFVYAMTLLQDALLVKQYLNDFLLYKNLINRFKEDSLLVSNMQYLGWKRRYFILLFRLYPKLYVLYCLLRERFNKVHTK